MPRRTLDWVLTAVVVFVLFLAFSTSLRLAVFTFLIPPGKTWHDLLTAVGTCAAAAVALWLGLDNRRRADSERMQVAQLVASEISARLAALEARVGSLQQLLQTSEQEDWREDLKTLRRELEKATEGQLFRRDTLEALIPLPRQTAHRVARAMDYLRLLRLILDNRRVGIETGSAAFINRLHKNVDKILRDTRNELEVASAECQKAAALAAPQISPELVADED